MKHQYKFSTLPTISITLLAGATSGGLGLLAAVVVVVAMATLVVVVVFFLISSLVIWLFVANNHGGSLRAFELSLEVVLSVALSTIVASSVVTWSLFVAIAGSSLLSSLSAITPVDKSSSPSGVTSTGVSLSPYDK